MLLRVSQHLLVVQIRLFYPELLHPAFGVIRSIVKDSTDTETGDSAVVFLDSDGLVSAHAQINPVQCHVLCSSTEQFMLGRSDACMDTLQVGALTRNASDSPSPNNPGNDILEDGRWHMVTLSSLYDDTRGYAMFIDGKLTAVLNGNQTYTGVQLNGCRQSSPFILLSLT